MKKVTTSLLVAAAMGAGAANATEIIHYENKPVTVHLQKGVERTIQVGDHVQVGVTSAQEMKRLFRVQSAQGAVHIRPNTEFDSERVQLRRIGDGQVILLDLISTSTADADKDLSEDIRIYVAGEDELVTSEQDVQPTNAPAPSPVTPITLTRFAVQQMYAPQRLHKADFRISPENISTLVDKNVRAFKGMNSVNTETKPVMAWRAGNLHLAAVLVRNTTQRSVKLSYMDINVPFTHATFQHHSLAPAGQPGDRTVMYLVNDRPLKETLVPWTYYSDLAAAADQKERK